VERATPRTGRGARPGRSRTSSRSAAARPGAGVAQARRSARRARRRAGTSARGRAGRRAVARRAPRLGHARERSRRWRVVEDDAERVEVAASVEPAVPRLGRRVEEGAPCHPAAIAASGAALPARSRRGAPRAPDRGERHPIDEHVRRLEVGVDHAAAVHGGQRGEHAVEQREERARPAGCAASRSDGPRPAPS